MNTRTSTTKALLALQARGARWLCVAAYAHAGHEQNDILSWHRTQHAANAAARGEFRKVVELADVIDDARHLDQAISAGSQ